MASRGGKVVLFGGYANLTVLGDTWEWDGSAWSQVATSGPPARAYATMAEHDGKVVLFGGEGLSGQLLSDTWEWDGTAWTQMNVAGPPARYVAAMASFLGKAILMGGQGDVHQVYGDTWQWDGATWTALQPNGPPEYQHGMARVGCDLVVSGFSPSLIFDNTYRNNTQIWNGTTWSPLPAELAPSERQWPAMAPTLAGALLFGGYDNTSPTGAVDGDTWLWDGTTWAQVAQSGPPGRMLAGMASY
jgi:hypothetical protein